ncbi:MAG: 4-hydroxythreonine-4-phosphate dehydrogenase PdxA [bacterium]|nr:4-hydroxythreonine-4-phosphate dehydrogenase PdxA [bacterium]
MPKLPIIGMTIGDPSGIGPEIVAKVLADKNVYMSCRPVVIGNSVIIQEGIRVANLGLQVKVIKDITEAKYVPGIIEVIEAADFNLAGLQYGKVQATSGKIAGQSIAKAIQLAIEHKIHAVVTAPINKESFNQGGFPYPGHTEMFAALTQTKNYSMMLVYGNLRVAHVTTHVSMRQALDLITTERVLNTIMVAYNACVSLGIKQPKIGVAGLNPHASDGGMFGDEEEKAIIPAIKIAQGKGIKASGPVPGDTVFAKARGGWFDAVVAMYHDQGHIPLKLIGFVWESDQQKWGQIAGVNITFGLPIIRTSVDHGTAFGKAGKGTADATSLKNAIEIAVTLAQTKFKEDLSG